MKNSYSTFLLFWIASVPAVLAQQMPSDEHFKEIVRSEMKANTGRINPVLLNAISDYDISYHRCEWKVDPSQNYIAGNITTYFKPLVLNFDSIKFDLSNSLTVDSVKYHLSSLTFTHSANIITAVFPSAIAMNTLDSVAVYYKGAPPSTGFGSFIQDTHNGAPVLWTLSEPYGSSDWWPCKNGLTDKADSIDVIVTVPPGNKVASNGSLVSVAQSGTDRVFHWKHRYPIATYLICFAATNYAEYTHNVPFGTTNTLVQNFVYPEDSAMAVSQTAGIIPVMQLYDSLFGIYPFVNDKYGHAQFGWGGGMEHQTITFLGGFYHELIAHELAHHWFGDKITCASWRDIWLNEGFASYLAGLTYEHMFNGMYWMAFKSSRIGSVTSKPDGSVWCDDTTSVNRIFDGRLTYDKGAMILHQLRWVIGDSAFYAAIKNYLTDPALAYGFAHTSDLISHFESSYGKKLDWYFNDWFTGEGYPSYKITWTKSGTVVNLTIDQTASDPSSVSFFKLPLPLEFKDATHDTIIRLDHVFTGQTFSIPLPFTVDSVKFDPELWLITKNNIVNSVKENEITQHISIFPNPAHDKIQIALTQSVADLSLRLFDITGRTIKIVPVNGMKNILIDLKELAKGDYVLEFNSKDFNTSKKIVVK